MYRPLEGYKSLKVLSDSISEDFKFLGGLAMLQCLYESIATLPNLTQPPKISCKGYAISGGDIKC